jgi:hypothetical protein
VTYTQANTRAVYRKTVDEIAEMLSHMNSPAAAADRERLANLDRPVTHVALVKERYQNIRANVLYTRLDPKGCGRIQISAELPLLYAQGRHPKIPEVHFPAEADDSKMPRRIRASKIESYAYLRLASGISLYRRHVEMIVPARSTMRSMERPLGPPRAKRGVRRLGE